MDKKIPFTGSDGKVHYIDPEMIDLFRHGSTGVALTDEEWDEQKRRLESDNANLIPREILEAEGLV